VHIAVEIH